MVTNTLDKLSSRPNLILILRITSALLFLGRAYQHLRWDAPYRTIFWNQSLLEPFVKTFLDMPWSEFAKSGAVDNFIVGFQHIIGAIFILCALASLVLTYPKLSNSTKSWRANKWLRRLLYLGSGLLFFLSFNLFLGKYFQIGQLIEHASQWATPVLLVFLIQEKSDKIIDMILKVAIASTFLGHGLYAVGFHPVPGHFVDMVIVSLGVSETAAKDILLVAGVLDVVIAALVFVRVADYYVLIWAIIWGFLTSLARVYAHVKLGDLASGLDAWAYQTILRAPHFLIPLVLWLRMRQIGSDK